MRQGMEEEFYQMIFKRKSFHLFRETQKIAPSKIDGIRERYQSLRPLDADIKTEIQIVPEAETTCRRGAEYCILFYSEKKGNYLQNIGYLGEQMDLYLASEHIGALWFGIGRTERKSVQGLDFVIMIAIAKMPEHTFRKNMFKSKRKPLEEIWQGDCIASVAEIARFAPSACNSQPWIVEAEDQSWKVYRYKKPGKRGIMPKDKVSYYNKIDIGIFLLFLDLCLVHENITFEKTVYNDNQEEPQEKVFIASYNLYTQKV